jgi:Tfp pilus assembly protein PilF
MNLKIAVRTLSASVVFTAATIAVPMALNSASATVGSSATFGAVAFAQDSGGASDEKEKTRVTPAMSEKMFKKFGKVQELGNPEEEGVEPNLEAALAELKEIQKDCDKCNKYELAIMYQYYGWLYYALEQPEKAIESYKNLLAQSPEIPYGLEVGTMYKLAQLNYAEDNYQEALKWLNSWMKIAENVNADAYVMRAQIYYQLGNNAKALEDVNTGVSMIENKGQTPKESWYNLQRALYLDKEDYKAAIDILEKMVVHYPKVQYWRQLSQLFGAVGREKDQMYLLDALYVSGLLDNKADVKNLALLLLGEQVPYKASKILEKGIDEELLEADSKNLEILANALRMAQEIKRSIPVLARAAKKSEDGDLFAQLAAVYLDADDNKKAVDAAKSALDRGELKRPGNLYLTKGMAHFNLEEYDSALKAFRQAAKVDEPGVKDFAQRWIQHVNAEKQRSDELKRSAEQEAPETPPIPQVDV